MASEKVIQLIEEVKNLTVLELSQLVKALEEEFGVSAASPVAVAVGTGPVAAEEVEEQTSFNVILSNAGEGKIKVIKVVREITGLGLKEAKDLVDNAPNAVKEGIEKAEAQEIKAKLEEVGATVEVK